MPLTKAERTIVVELVTDAIGETIAGFEREVDALRGRVQLLESQLTKNKSASPGGAAVGVDLADRLAAGVRAYVAKSVAPLAARLAAIEAKGLGEYLGTFQPGRTYTKGQFVTFDGSVWHANRQTSAKPPGGDWTLAVKKGTDAPSR